MHTNPVEELLVGRPRLTIILVHGRALTPAYMQALAERLALDDVRYLFPAADDDSWYPNSFMADFEDNEPQLTAALEHYEFIVSGLIEVGVPPDRIVVGGFSQGACLSASFLCHHPRRYGAAILWSGGLIGPDGLLCPARPQLSGMPAYITTSAIDPYIPAARVRQTERWLSGSGAEVSCTIFPDREHEVNDAEIAAARAMVERVKR